MANHKSAEKRAKQSLVKRERNKAKKSETRTWVKKLRDAIDSKDKTVALNLLPQVQKLLAKLAKSSATTKQNSARKTSRLASQVAKL